MKPLPLIAALLLALGLPCLAQAERFTYHGDLLDGSAPAEGRYDLRVRSYANNGAKTPLGEATELPAVAIRDGRFAVELDIPEDADGISWVEVAVRRSGSGEDYVVLGAPQPIAKVNSTCPGAWALDGNAGAPAGSYLGFADDRAVFISSSAGVALNSTTAGPAGNTDLVIHPRSGGDADVDINLVTRSGKLGQTYVRDGNGNVVNFSSQGGFEFLDGIPTATQNNGLATFDVGGRLRSRAAGAGATDTSGGLWFDDERAYASFVGRGDNQSNWTGFFEATGGWRFTAHDNGAFGFNTNTEALSANQFKVNAAGGVRFNAGDWPTLNGDGLVVGPRASLSDNTIAVLARRQSGEIAVANFGIQLDSESAVPALLIGTSIGNVEGNISLANNVGIKRRPAINALEVDGNASKTTAGDWLANSDRRIKTAVAPIPHALDTIMKLRPVTFRYSADYREKNPDIAEQRYYNVIAQEFAEVFPEAVKGSGEYLPGQPKTAANEILQVDTYPAQITALAAIQELAVQDAALREELSSAQAENAALRADLDALLRRVTQLEMRRER